MARARLVAKALSTSQRYAELHRAAGPLAEFCQSLYPLLIAHADDFGRQAGDVFTIKHAVCPTSPRMMPAVAQALQALHEVGLVVWYEVNGRKYLQIVEFDRHQQGLHKRTRSEFPDVSGNFQEFPGTSGNVPESPGTTGNPPEILGSRARAELNRTELNRTNDEEEEDRAPAKRLVALAKPRADALTAAFDAFWRDYPKHERKSYARAVWTEIAPSAETQQVIRADIAQRCLSSQWRTQNGKYIPLPENYLEKRRWDDDFREATAEVVASLDTRPDVNGHYPHCETATVCRAKLEAEIEARRKERTTAS